MSARRVLTRTGSEVHLAEDVELIRGADPWTRCTGKTLCEHDAWEVIQEDEGPAVCQRCRSRAVWGMAFTLCRLTGREDYEGVEAQLTGLIYDLIAEKGPR